MEKKNYLEIPSLQWFGKLFMTIAIIFLAVLNFKLILKTWDVYNLGYVFTYVLHSKQDLSVNGFGDLVIIYPFIGEYILISFAIFGTLSLFKEIVSDFPFWLFCGLITGIAGALVCGGFLSQVFPIGGFVAGMILGMICCLIAGFITTLTLCLLKEFNIH